MKKTGPDSLEGCFMALTVCLISTLMYGMADLSSLLFVACITRYNTDRNRASLPFVLNSVIQAFSGPFVGYFAKKFGVKVVVLFGSVMGFAGIVTCFFAESIIEVTILWGIVFGIGFGCSTLLLPAIINEYFFKHRSKALGVSYLGSPIGFLIFPPIFEALIHKYGLSGTFLFLSGINLHCIPLSLLLRQPNFKEDDANSPLSTDKEQAVHISTDSRASLQNSATGSKTMLTEKAKNNGSFCRRNSIEFLWKQAERDETITNINEHKGQYIFTLNKNNFSPTRRLSDSVRSYKKKNINCYKNLANEYVVPHFSSPRDDSKLDNSKNFQEEHCTSSISDEVPSTSVLSHNKEKDTTQSSLNVKKNRQDVNETENFEMRKLQLPDYKECSTIYFGTNEKVDNIDIRKPKIKSQPNFYARNCVEKSNGNGLNSHISSAKPDNIQKSSSGIPEESSATNSEEQKKESRWTKFFQNKSLVRMYYDPVFIVMCISNAIFSLQFTTLATVIIDFAEDHHIDPSHEKFIMMCISIMGLVGMIGFGWVTDGGYMTRHRFGSLCLLVGSISIALLPQIIDLATLITVLSIWCVSQSSFVLLIPAIIAEYLEKDIQTVAVSAAYVLCGPLYFIIPPLLGYFRDGKGSYDSVFYLISSLSLLNCILVFLVPCMARSRTTKEEKSPNQKDCRT